MDEEIVQLVRDVIDSRLTLKILEFFYGNLSAMATPRCVASAIGEDEGAAALALEHLCEHGVLRRIGKGGPAIYVFAPGKEVWQRIRRLIHAYYREGMKAQIEEEIAGHAPR